MTHRQTMRATSGSGTMARAGRPSATTPERANSAITPRRKSRISRRSRSRAMERSGTAPDPAPNRALACSIRMSRRSRLWARITSTRIRLRPGGLYAKSLLARLRDEIVDFHLFAPVNKERAMNRMRMQFHAVLLAMACALLPAAKHALGQSAPPGASELSGLASVSGTVTSASTFKAARVYFRNVDKRMQYMVYTADGKYHAMHLLPGKYEMRVEARSLDSPVTEIVLKPGSNPPQNATLRPVQSTGAQIVTLNEMFPPGPGQRYAKEVCLGCHAPDQFGSLHMDAAAWDAYVGMMLKGGQIPMGFSSQQERDELAQYLGKHFGPESRKRTVKWEKEVPLDEAKLAKAMYIEYYLAPNSDQKLRRRGQDPHFDQQGNVWITDRNVPNRLAKLDPRTGEWKDWLMPHPEGETNGLTIDRDGIG